MFYVSEKESSCEDVDSEREKYGCLDAFLTLCKASQGDVFQCEGEAKLVHGQEEGGEKNEVHLMYPLWWLMSDKGEKKVCRGHCTWGGGGQASGEKEEVLPFTFIQTLHGQNIKT